MIISEQVHHIFWKIFICIIFLLLSYSLIGKNLQANWWIIDDHGIMNYIGQEYRMSPSRWLSSFKNSEAFSPGSSPRYRPTYYALQFSEMLLWGKNPFLWQLVRFCFFVIFQIIAWSIARRYIGDILGFVFVLYLLSLSFWQYTILQLGPSETYAILGLPLFVLGFINIWSLDFRLSNWIIFLLGTLICGGVKESFVFLLLPIIIIFIKTSYLKKWTYFSILCWVSSLIFCLFILSATYISTQKLGVDIYSQSTLLSDRIQFIFNGLKRLMHYPEFVGTTLLVLGIGYYYFIFKRDFSKVSQYFLWVILLVTLSSIWISQYFFYNGIWPQSNRYDYPGVLIPPALLLLSLNLLRILFLRNSIYLKIAKSANRTFPKIIIISLFVLIFINSTSYNNLRAASLDNVNKTNEFIEKLNYIDNEIRRTGLPVVFYTSKGDLEPIASIRLFLNNYYNYSGNYYLIANSCNDNIVDPWKRKLIDIVCKWSSGSDGFTPIQKLGDTKTICVVFSGELPESNSCVSEIYPIRTFDGLN